MAWPKGKKHPEISELARQRFKGEKNPMKSSEIVAKAVAKRSITVKKNGTFRGENNPMYGRKGKLSPNFGKKRIFSPAHCKKMSEAWTTERRSSHGSRMKRLGESHPLRNPVQRERMRKANPMKQPDQIERMKNGGSAYSNSFNKSPSKPQVQLYEQVQILYSSAVLNYPFRNYSIDIAIPELKIAIEFDGEYWHKGREEYDRKRQLEIEKEGWKFLRFQLLPTNEELEKSLNG